MIPIRTALLSVSDKTGLEKLARFFSQRGITMYATGGTSRFIREKGMEVQEVSEVTGSPEILGGRVKTLHPVIAGGILGRRDLDSDRHDLEKHNIRPIDLVVCNLYPFEKMVDQGETTLSKVVEEIDIGGITLLRAAAKNSRYVVVLSSPENYDEFMRELEVNDGFSEDMSLRWAVEAFRRTAAYDAQIASYLSELAKEEEPFPSTLPLCLNRMNILRYGENPHQKGAFYRDLTLDRRGFMASMEQLGGKELSFNNLYDTQAAFGLVREFEKPAVVVVKHNNPCGTASDDSLSKAALKAREGDPVSAFGGIVAFNQTVDKESAQVFKDLFIEVVCAPDFTREAMDIFSAKKGLRILRIPIVPPSRYDLKKVDGGFLLQDNDVVDFDPDALKTVTSKSPSDGEMKDMLFAWVVARYVKSNTIILAKKKQVVGVGAGQMSRIDALRIALAKADDRAHGAVLASDAFFPFPDVVEEAAAGGITSIIQPGGSIKDQDSIDMCNRLGLSMVFSGVRHFRH